MGSPLWGAAKTNGNSPGRIASSTKGPQDTYRLTSAKYESSLKVYQIRKKQAVIAGVSKEEGEKGMRRAGRESYLFRLPRTLDITIIR